MAFKPIAFLAPQYENYPNYWIKFYKANTTTPAVISIDSTGNTTLEKARINLDGFIVTDGNAIFTPHINEVYDAYLFPTELDANQNITANAIRVAQNIKIDGAETGSIVESNIDSVERMKQLSFDDNQKITCNRRYENGDAVSGLIYEHRLTGVADGFFNHATQNGVAFLVGAETASQKQCGAVMDGVADDTDAIEAWLNGASVPTVLPGTSMVSSSMEVTSPVIAKNKNFIIKPILASGEFRVLHFRTDDVDIELTIDATGGTFAGATANKYAIFGGDSNGATKYKNHTYKCYIKNWLYTDNNTGTSNLLVSHCIYTFNVDDVNLSNSQMHDSSGAAFFIRQCNGFTARNVKCSNNVWYPFNLEEGVENFDISHNEIDQSNLTNGVFWGGSINIQSQQVNGGERNSHGTVAHNTIKGKHSYGSVIRCNSADSVDIHNNKLIDIETGLVTSGAGLTAIRVDTRGISTAAQNGPCQQIKISHNVMNAINSATDVIGIYVSNQWQTTRNPIKGLAIVNNEIKSANTTDYFENAIILHGFSGGIENVEIKNNFGQVFMQTSPIVNGAVGMVATNASGKIDGVELGGNDFEDLGTSAESYQIGIAYGQFVDNVTVTSTNTLDNFHFGTRSFTDSGPILNFINDIDAPNIGNTIGIYGVSPSKYRDLGESLTSAELSDINDVVNLNKWQGKQAFDRTSNKPVWAATANPNGAWKDAQDTTVYTPS